jgi:hypothetical protein
VILPLNSKLIIKTIIKTWLMCLMSGWMHTFARFGCYTASFELLSRTNERTLSGADRMRVEGIHTASERERESKENVNRSIILMVICSCTEQQIHFQHIMLSSSVFHSSHSQLPLSLSFSPGTHLVFLLSRKIDEVYWMLFRTDKDAWWVLRDAWAGEAEC